MPTNTDLVKDLPADFEVFGQAVDTSLAELKGGTTGQILSKTSNTDMDFTWTTPNVGDITEVQAGTGISVASGTGPIPVVTNTVATAYDAKGDLVVGTGADTFAKLTAGNNGDTLLADSSTTTGLRWQGDYAAGRNFTINGGFDVWQRGTSFATGALNYFADRWQSARVAQVAGMTISRQTTGDTTNLPFIQYCARVQRDSGNSSTNSLVINTAFETTNSIPLAGKTVTLSFYARAGANYSPTSSALTYKLETGTGTDQNNLSGSFTGVATPISATATLTTTWQRFQTSATLASTATQIGLQFAAAVTGTAGANDYFEITGVMLSVGSVAQQFARAGVTLQGEYELAKRYFEFIGNGGTAGGGMICNSFVVDANNQSGVFTYTEKRVVPSFTLGAASNFLGASSVATSVSVGRPTVKAARLDVTTTGSPFTTGQGSAIRFADSSTAGISISAEL
jgi:hypothetical protein